MSTSLSEQRRTGIIGLDYDTREPREVVEGDTVWGVQPKYYGHDVDWGNRNTAGIVFWNEHQQEWRIFEDSFSEFCGAMNRPEHSGYPLAKLQKLLVFKKTEKTIIA